jgi:hypothetical protein
LTIVHISYLHNRFTLKSFAASTENINHLKRISGLISHSNYRGECKYVPNIYL